VVYQAVGPSSPAARSTALLVAWRQQLMANQALDHKRPPDSANVPEATWEAPPFARPPRNWLIIQLSLG